jgi:fatty acid desaturase
MKKLLLDYGLIIVAGIFSFLLALNARVVVMMVYRIATIGVFTMAGSFVNAVSIILIMVLWLIYIFYLQHRLEKKCENPDQYRRTIVRFILPMPVLYAVSEIIIRGAIS